MKTLPVELQVRERVKTELIKYLVVHECKKYISCVVKNYKKINCDIEEP